MYNYFLQDDSIVAVSSPPGIALRGIIRLTGPDALPLAGRFFYVDEKPADLARFESWTHHLGRLVLPDNLSCPCQVYIFRAPFSYTTQDLAEFHLPGSPALLQMLLEEFLAAGARLAQPGEFTARAFINNRLDLTESQAVAALVSARSDSQLRAAELLLDGNLHHHCLTLSNQLADALSLVELQIDFSEEDLLVPPVAKIRRLIHTARDQLNHLLQNSISWKQLEHLPRVAVCGPANAGKSTLINRLVGFDRSIVSDIAGTTRDLLTVPLQLPHGECLLIDTAGLGPTRDPLAGLTQPLTRRAISSCDLLLWVFDCSVAALSTAADIPAGLPIPANLILVANKIDLCPDHQPSWPAQLPVPGPQVIQIAVSALRGDNVDTLITALDDLLQRDLHDYLAGPALALSAHQRQALVSCSACLTSALALLADNQLSQPELLALELRSAIENLGLISGASVTEQVLDRIFSQFCIGK